VTYRFSSRSTERLETCHPDLVLLMNEALADPECPSDMSILCGYRGEEEQNAAFESGASQLRYPQSRHNREPSLAVDVAPYVGGITWDWQYYYPLADHIKATWARLSESGQLSGDYRLQWGGDWTSFKDGPQWELREL